MSESKSKLSKNLTALLWIFIFAVVIYQIIRNISTFGNVLLVALGFGVVILVHEFGHFISAKLSDIKVEAFSIGFPPILLGILRTEKGWRIRILPGLFAKEAEPKDGESGLSFTIGKKAKPGETEYRIGLIPFGGFVKMLGQEDVGTVEATEDPRSYINKPVICRMAVLASGVVFNAISAIIIFMIVFLIGINLPPAIIGGVIPGSPAAQAGLKAGDEVIEIDNKTRNLDFSSIMVAAALSNEGEKVPLKVKHEDGSIEEFDMVAKQLPGERLRVFGIERPMSLTISDVSDPNFLLETTGLLPRDFVKAVNGQQVQAHWQLEQIVQNAVVPTVSVLVERTNDSGQSELVQSQIPLSLRTAETPVESESDLSHICSIVPRLKINVAQSDINLQSGDIILAVSGIENPKSGDVIMAAGGIENPTYKELRDITEEHEKKKLSIKVLRTDPNGLETILDITVMPKRPKGSDRVMIGIGLELDSEHPVVAKTISSEVMSEPLQIPRGAVITSVGKVRVSNFYDVISQIRNNAGKRITINYRLDEKIKGKVILDSADTEKLITVKSSFAEIVPFRPLEKLYKARNPINAIMMGYNKTVMFIAQTYATLKHLVAGLVSTKDLMGPVGIVAFSYRLVAEQPLVYYIYFLGLMSACIAVFNFLPLPPLDGGLFAILIIEKIKGSALSERTQGIIAYAGWVIIGSFVLYVTFNDIVNNFFR